MTSLKEHQAAMVTMLASGTAIPTSAIRLAHAVHDILAKLNDTQEAPVAHTERRSDSTTSGLNDVLLASDVAAVAPKNTIERAMYSVQQDMMRQSEQFARRVYLESLLKQRDNTIRQLKSRVADLVKERAYLVARLGPDETEKLAEQAGCRKEDTQLGEDGWVAWGGGDCPVDGDAEVQVRFRSGAYHRGAALGFEWEHHNAWLDVTAYRVVDK